MGEARQPGEPRWSEEDTLYALEWQAIQDGTCSGCGQPLIECMDQENGYDVRIVRCFGCEAKESEAKRLSELDEPNHGKKILVHRIQ